MNEQNINGRINKEIIVIDVIWLIYGFEECNKYLGMHISVCVCERRRHKTMDTFLFLI